MFWVYSAVTKCDTPDDTSSLDDFTSEHQLICTKLLEVSKAAKLSTHHEVAQLVEALRYKLEGRGFDSWRCHCRQLYGLGVDTASNRSEYQDYFPGVKGGRWVGLTTLPHSCAECLEIWEPQPPGTLRACPSPFMDGFTLRKRQHCSLSSYGASENCGSYVPKYRASLSRGREFLCANVWLLEPYFVTY